MSIPDACPMCGSSRSRFRRSRSTGRVTCGVCGEAVDGGGTYPGRPFGVPGEESLSGTGRAADRVRSPAIGLLVVGTLSFAVALFWTVAFIIAAVENPTPQNLDAAGNVAAQMVGYYIAMLSGPVASLALTATILFGGYQMLTVRSWAWALVGTLAAMAPCCNFTALIGFPIGIWALIVLFDPPVRAAFR